MSQTSATLDIAALMPFLDKRDKERDQRDKEERAQRCEKKEQARREREEQARREREEQSRRMEEQARRMEEQFHRGLAEQNNRFEQQMHVMKDLSAEFHTKLQVVEEQVHKYDERITKTEAQVLDIRETLNNLKTGSGSTISTLPSSRGFKVPPFDGTSSWSAYRKQFEAVMKAND